MILHQGVLRPRVAGRQVSPTRYKHKTEGISIKRIDNLINTGNPNICLIRSLGGIGDVLMTTPTVRALKYKWPNSHLTYATDFRYMDGSLRDVLLYNPYIDELVQYHTVGTREFDLKVDITSVCISSEKPNMVVSNRIDLFAQHVGISLDKSGYLPVYIVSEDEKQWAKEKLFRYPRRASNTPRVGIQARSSTVTRSWPIDRIRDLAIKLSKNNIQVVVFDSSHGGGPQETWNISGVIAIKDYKIRQIAALINEMDLMITPDSGLMHIAGALDKKIVSIWAGTDPQARINHYPNAISIARTNLACFPCWYNASPCNKSYNCIKSITVDEVYNQVIKHLTSSHRSFVLNDCDTMCIKRAIGGYGDILCTTCAVDELKKQYPHRDIVIAMPEKYHCIFDNNPNVSRCIEPSNEFMKDMNVYDLTDIDARSEVSELNQYNEVQLTRPQVYIRAVGGSIVGDPSNYVPKLYLSNHEIEWAKKRFCKDPSKKYIVVAIKTAETYRNWPYEHYLNVFDMSKRHKKKWRFIIVDGSRFLNEIPSNVLDGTGFAFRKTMSIVSIADCVLTPDTSILHVAAALNKPCITLFGPIGAAARCQFYKNTHVICSDTDCIPCWRNNDIQCKRNHTGDNMSYCLQQIKPSEVFSALTQILEG